MQKYNQWRPLYKGRGPPLCMRPTPWSTYMVLNYGFQWGGGLKDVIRARGFNKLKKKGIQQKM